MNSESKREAVIIGSGFGGAITACRLSKKWPGQVTVLERGKRYPMYSFPRTPHDMANNFWNIAWERKRRPAHLKGKEMHGIFDIRSFNSIDAVVGAGLGGGSLIYANVFLEPPDEVFDERWPASCGKQALQPYYQVAKSVLGARPIPQTGEPARNVLRTEVFQEFAQQEGRESRLLDLNVFFGNDFDNPTPIGQQERNAYGALQTSCVYCAECDVGCNTHSKNTLDLNYLYVAEHRYNADIQTEMLAEKIVPLNGQQEDDPLANGEHGYRVYYIDLNHDQQERSIVTQRVVVSAGTLGSNELLLRCRDIYRSLPNINHNLGRHFSGNGDFLSFVIDGDRPARPNYGPVITQATDYNLFKDFNRDHAFLLEDASYPSFASWYIEGLRPGFSHLAAFLRTVRMVIGRFFHGMATGRVGYAFNQLMKGDLSYDTAVLLCMGIDRSDGRMTLDDDGYVDVDWPTKRNMSLYTAITDMGKRFKQWLGGRAFVPLPTWYWPLRRNITVHSLGGCRLADRSEDGVTSADPETMGQVFGYQGLYVADGAIVPTAVGANPTATISALSERVAEGITGIQPDADL